MNTEDNIPELPANIESGNLSGLLSPIYYNSALIEMLL